MKKFLKLVLSLAIILTLISCSNDNVVVKNDKIVTESIVKDTGDNLTMLDGEVDTLSKYKLPKIGDIMFGYTVKAIYDYDDRNAKVVLFEHDKTGANIVLISNDDVDKKFDICFRTIAFDNVGIPHIFEHAALSGSTRYPNPDLFFAIANRTYNTDVNATTDKEGTFYYASSLDDNQLFAMYKYYMDGVFNPIVLTDKRSLQREGFRYVLYDKNDDLKASGVVYSEMTGHEGNIYRKHSYNTVSTLFPNSNISSITGGLPKDIVNIKMEDLKKFHETYYQPTNMVLTLYGDIDYEKYLKFADEEYLSNYEKKEIEFVDKNYVKNEGFVSKTYQFPVAKDADVKKGSMYSYAVYCEGISLYEIGNFELVFKALDLDDGPLKTRLREKLPDADVSIEPNLFMSKPYFEILYRNVDEEDGDTLKTITEDAFNDLVENGIRKEVVDSIEDMLLYNKETTKDSHGLDHIECLIMEETGFGKDGAVGFLKYKKGISDIEYRYKDGSIEKLIKKYLGDNSASALIGTIKTAGLLEKKIEEEKQVLAEKKKSFTDKEIEEIITDNKEIDEWTELCARTVNIDAIRVASVSSLSESTDKCYVYEENEQGIRFLRSEIDDIHYNRFNILFDTSGVKKDDIFKLTLLTDILFFLPTENYIDQTLAATMDRNSINYNVGVNAVYFDNGGYKPYFEFAVTSLDKHIDKVFELLKELMHNTKFDDIELFKSKVESIYNNIKLNANSDPRATAYNFLRSKVQKEYNYSMYAFGIDYLRYLDDVKKMNDEEIISLLSDCKMVLESIYNKDGMVCEIIANFDTMKNIKNKVIELSDNFKVEKIEEVDYGFENMEIKNNTAIVLTSENQYNVIGTIPTYRDILGKETVIAKIVNDKILYPEFRAKRSCYGAYCRFDRLYNSIYTYRDPNLKETFDVYKEIPLMLNNGALTEQDLEDYKISAYADFSYPLSKYNAASIGISESLHKYDEKRHIRFKKAMKDIKEVSLSNIATLSNVVKDVVDNGYIVTAGSEKEIEKDKELFDEIIYDFVK